MNLITTNNKSLFYNLQLSNFYLPVMGFSFMILCTFLMNFIADEYRTSNYNTFIVGTSINLDD